MEAYSKLTGRAVWVAVVFLVVVVMRGGVAKGYPGDVSTLWNMGVGYYRAGHYDSAYSVFSELVRNGYYSCALFRNLGNAAWQLQRVGEARLWWERAYQLCPFDEELYNNLVLAAQTVKDSPPPPVGGSVLMRAVLLLVFLFEDWRGWMVVGLVGWVLLWIFLYVFVVRKVRRVWVLAVLVVCGLMVAGGVGGLVFIRWRLALCNLGVNVESVELFSEPVEGAEPLTTIPAGYFFWVDERSPKGWLKVHTRGGVRGWVPSGAVVPLSLRGC